MSSMEMCDVSEARERVIPRPIPDAPPSHLLVSTYYLIVLTDEPVTMMLFFVEVMLI